MAALETSILKTIKHGLDVEEDNNEFDKQIILHINSVIPDLHQLGVGPVLGFEVTDDTETWQQLLGETTLFNDVKSFMVLRLKQLFDPPKTSFELDALDRLVTKAEWRINIRREEAINPWTPPVVLLEE